MNLTTDEVMAILGRENLRIETATVRGTYFNGVPFEREYAINVSMRMGDTFNFSLKITYPKDETSQA